MTTKLDDISEAIGNLRARVEGIGQKIDRADANAADSNRRADEHRAAIHRRVDDLVDEVGGLKTDVALVKTDVADTKSVTDEVLLWKQRGIGALFVSGIAGSAVGASIAYWWEAILRALRSG